MPWPWPSTESHFCLPLAHRAIHWISDDQFSLIYNSRLFTTLHWLAHVRKSHDSHMKTVIRRKCSGSCLFEGGRLLRPKPSVYYTNSTGGVNWGKRSASFVINAFLTQGLLPLAGLDSKMLELYIMYEWQAKRLNWWHVTLKILPLLFSGLYENTVALSQYFYFSAYFSNYLTGPFNKAFLRSINTNTHAWIILFLGTLRIYVELVAGGKSNCILLDMVCREVA